MLPFQSDSFFDESLAKDPLFELFKTPPAIYHPFVRWWWNGNRIEEKELIRELELLKAAGIGGVEVNPVKFPPEAEHKDIPAIKWLSPEWIGLLQKTFTKAASLGMTCDLIVGSGWPFGAEWLEGEERAQIVVIGIKKLEGPLDYEISPFDLLKEADPPISSAFTGRKPEILSLKLVPDPLTSIEQVKDLTTELNKGFIQLTLPKGKFVLYALVKIHGFMEVINGAPGANGPILNHYNETAVKKYLDRMSDTIQQHTGPLSKNIRALFTDSLELEGANWTNDMLDEFKKRRGYDLYPYLPFLLFRIGSLGNTWDYNYGASLSPGFKDMIQRMRYDFELTRTELLEERFLKTFLDWCRRNKVNSRVQAYGRGYFPLDGSLDIDLPECETWIRVGLGKEMSGEDYRRGRAYTMINKFVSSAAHLKGKKYISSEELTNIDFVFNEPLELCKIAGDQSIISGVTHSIFHGFNYSPPSAGFPGWVRYGTYLSEQNQWWPYFKYYNEYRARISALLQQSTMFADIALLPPIADLWSIYSAQNEPFPAVMHPSYQTLIWESIHQNGNACDYISERVISNSELRDGVLHYGARKYHTIFLINVASIEPSTAQKLYDFISAGGRIFCIESFPDKTPGWYDHAERDQELLVWINRMKTFPSRFILLQKPGKDFTKWFADIQEQFQIKPYVQIKESSPFVSQVRYQQKDMEIFFFNNSNIDEAFKSQVSFSKEITDKKQGWIWDPETGERYRIPPTSAGTRAGDSNNFLLELGPAESRLIIFDKTKSGKDWIPLPKSGIRTTRVSNWKASCNHKNGTVQEFNFETMQDLKDIPQLQDFCGTVTYSSNLTISEDPLPGFINLGKVHGIAELAINGQDCGVKWYGHRIFSVADKLKIGNNTIVIKIVTGVGNYLKSLKDNRTAQYWTNEGRRNQPLQPMGLLGPVIVY